MKRIKYNQKPPPFYTELRSRIYSYLRENSLTRYADWRMNLKTIVTLTIWFSLYGLIISNWFKSYDLILFQVAFHWLSFTIWLGIAHDAIHNAYTKNKFLNK